MNMMKKNEPISYLQSNFVESNLVISDNSRYLLGPGKIPTEFM